MGKAFYEILLGAVDNTPISLGIKKTRFSVTRELPKIGQTTGKYNNRVAALYTITHTIEILHSNVTFR